MPIQAQGPSTLEAGRTTSFPRPALPRNSWMRFSVIALSFLAQLMVIQGGFHHVHCARAVSTLTTPIRTRA